MVVNPPGNDGARGVRACTAFGILLYFIKTVKNYIVMEVILAWSLW
jgi:hypothetical protein